MARGRRLPKALPAGDLARLLDSLGTDRDGVAVRLTYLCGLRVSEVAALRVEHVDLDTGVLLVAQGKGAKDRYVPIPTKLRPPLGEWIGQRRGWVFPGRFPGRHVSARTLREAVDRLAREAGLSRHVSPHMLRHTYAVTLLRTGADIYEVKELLGHSSIQTTAVYLSVTADRLARAVDRL